MGMKSTAEATGASIILLIFFPILIAKLMANKYHKDGFLGMIKAILAVLIVLSTLLFVYSPLKQRYNDVKHINNAIEWNSKNIKAAEETMDDLEELSKEPYRLLVKYGIKSAEIAKEEQNEYLGFINSWSNEIATKKAILHEVYTKIILLVALAFAALLVSIKLFISSSNRSRALAKADKELAEKWEKHRQGER